MVKIKAASGIVARRLVISLLVIACGLTLRLTGYEIGLRYFLVKYGGSLLWGTMVFWLVGVLLPHQPVVRLAMISAAIAVVTEFTRLYHTPWLDQFRLELVGALLLGRIFSWANIVAYLLGIFLAAWIERRVLAPAGSGEVYLAAIRPADRDGRFHRINRGRTSRQPINTAGKALSQKATRFRRTFATGI